MADDEKDNATVRILRDIQRELADMRDDRTVMMAILTRVEARVNALDVSVDTIGAEMRALRSQFDRFRNEVRERLATGDA